MSEIHPTGIDAYKPSEIANLVRVAGVAKVHLPLVNMFTLAVLAGAFIAFGAVAFSMVMTGTDPGFGPSRFLGGVVFSLGLILVVVGGAELFTGNALIVMAAVDRLVAPAELLQNWMVVYAGNFIGAVGLAAAMALSGMLDGPIGATAASIAEAKAALGSLEALMRGVLCNVLVCLAVWLSLAARTVTGKILAIVWPIATFVLLGFEHSIANMYLIPQGIFAGATVSAADFAHNLFFVTIGNIIGGAGGVALAYRLAYGPRSQR
ncbi:formate/nitrite transporter family protein [Hoeflea poritis]|uniref:Formate/nitrite transporter family protein n=1 Tax=Hoeflea poritis TaxID=2993659 RepID=A0ABT4VUJ8_9HYPH|nr:formate/nitrite transporter family protein [Hoeflea poritis]MDA4848391.1 formate/nitrite transporter family protein [Hoeflea poritis]